VIVCARLQAGVSDAFVRSAIVGLAEHDRQWYRRHRGAQSPAQAGIVYAPDPVADSIELLDAPALLAAGVGSCGSLGAAQWGWSTANGTPAWLLITQRGPLWHVRVRTAAGIWDPGEILEVARGA
jgi:hypothetical protein